MASSSSVIPPASSPPSISPSLPPFPPVNQTLTIKLNSTNYIIWKTQLLNIVIANGIDHLLDSSISPPPQFLDSLSSDLNPEYTIWMRYNRLVMSWIFSSLSEDLLPQIVSFTTASGVWEALARMFASSSLARVTDLRSQLHSLSKEGLSAVNYIKKITALCNTLAEIDEPVSDRDRLIYFLSGLGSEYNAFVVSITNRAEPPSWEEVHSLLQSFDFRLEKQSSVVSQPIS